MIKSFKNLQNIFLLTLVVLTIFSVGLKKSNAVSIEELQKDIEVKSKEIDALNKEIEQLGQKIETTTATGQTLQGAIKNLNNSGVQLNSQVKLTENKISKTDLSIQEIGFEIGSKEDKINQNLDIIANTIRNINFSENISAIATILSQKNLSSVWENLDTLEKFQTSIKDQIHSLRGFKTELEIKKAQTEKLKKEYEGLKSQLVDQKKIVDQNKKEKATLLSATKNEEANYKKILAEKKALSDAFLKEIFDIESQIKIIIDPNSIPKATKGLLTWPVDNVRITQYFGDTSFAKTGAYNGKGHNGIDLGVPMGSPVKAVLGGKVEETGNTDVLPRCLSYGKWVFIRHNNGLSSVYGHLSLIKAKAGDVVKAGDIVAYSGSTGYSTGPHLHLSLFASQGVSVQPLSKSINCKNLRIPMASQNAYLDPFPYF